MIKIGVPPPFIEVPSYFRAAHTEDMCKTNNCIWLINVNESDIEEVLNHEFMHHLVKELKLPDTVNDLVDAGVV